MTTLAASNYEHIFLSSTKQWLMTELLLVDNEPDPEMRFHPRAIADQLPDADHHWFVENPDPSIVGDVDGVVLSGSTAGVYERSHSWVDPGFEVIDRCVDRGVPLLGICFGHQLINTAFGGTVEERTLRAGFVEWSYDDNPLFEDISDHVPVYHGDYVVERGEGMEIIGRAPYYEAFATAHTEHPIWSVQFHPEFRAQELAEIDEWSDNGFSAEGDRSAVVLENFVEICEKRAT